MNCPHCNTHIDEHPASRCLDAWVAEAVMEWQRGTIFIDQVETEVLKHPSIFDEFDQYPCYSTSIAAAWEVVEKLQSSGMRTKLGNSTVAVAWSVDLWDEDAYLDPPWDKRVAGAIAPTAPLAICRAAIKAKRRGG